jgi:hypothetical protein
MQRQVVIAQPKPSEPRRQARNFVKASLSRLACLCALLTVVPLASAQARGILETLFGILSARPPTPPRGAIGHAEPSADPLSVARPGGQAGRGIAYCVRLCDGRYFPLTGKDREMQAETCTGLCPASATRIYWGSHAGPRVADDGSHYEALPNAYIYRETLLPGCTCNGKTSYGLASMDTATDPTLRRGDIIATADGLKVYASAARAGSPPADLVPVEIYSRLPATIRRKLTTMRIAPAD